MQKESMALEQKRPQRAKSWHDFCRIFEIFDDKKEFIPNDTSQTKIACLYQQIVHAESNIYKSKWDLELACELRCRRSKYLAFWCLDIKPRFFGSTTKPQVELFTMYQVYDQGESWRWPGLDA
jgi:hypothetical protein